MALISARRSAFANRALGLQCKDVEVVLGSRILVLPDAKTKTETERAIPIGGRLAAVLEMRRHAPDGKPLGPDAYVFGNAVGEQGFKVQKAWMTCVLKAHGHTPQWVKETRRTTSLLNPGSPSETSICTSMICGGSSAAAYLNPVRHRTRQHHADEQLPALDGRIVGTGD